MHQSSGQWQLGLLLSLITALLWGMLPIALKGLLQDMDATTITWYRFLVAAIVMWLFLAKNNKLPDYKWIKSGKLRLLFIIVILGLTSNYLFYLMGLDYVTPSAGQIVIQLAPLLLLIGGLAVFKEQFNLYQWIGLCVFLIGFTLFFNHRLGSIFSSGSQYSWGLLLIVFAAITWAAYALAQKQLLKHYNSQQIMLVVYIFGSLIFLPGAEFSAVLELTGWQVGLLIFCCFNTLIAYGSFAEALEHWEASRVSAVLAITPLLTMMFAALTDYYFPNYLALEDLNWLSILGGFVLVLGASMTALAKKKTQVVSVSEELIKKSP